MPISEAIFSKSTSLNFTKFDHSKLRWALNTIPASEVNQNFSNNIISPYKSRKNFSGSPKHIWVLRVWWAGFSRKYRIWLAKNWMIGIQAGSSKPYLGEIAWCRSAGFLFKIELPMIRSGRHVQTLLNRFGITRYLYSSLLSLRFNWTNTITSTFSSDWQHRMALTFTWIQHWHNFTCCS